MLEGVGIELLGFVAATLEAAGVLPQPRQLSQPGDGTPHPAPLRQPVVPMIDPAQRALTSIHRERVTCMANASLS
jgi:hypothetical protein